MAKGIRSKVKKRFRTAKRELVDASIEKKRKEQAHLKQKLVAEGRYLEVMPKKKKNAFLYPDDPESAFPQHEVVKPLDLRSAALPGSANAFVGGRRKFTEEEKARRKSWRWRGPGRSSGSSRASSRRPARWRW